MIIVTNAKLKFLGKLQFEINSSFVKISMIHDDTYLLNLYIPTCR